MSGIFSSLSSAAYALQTHSRSVEMAGKNIANINNPNYTRQRVLTGTQGSIRTSIGVESGPLVAVGLEQVRDRFIDRQLLGEIAYDTELKSEDFRLRQALANLGDNIDRAGDAQFVEDIAQSGGGLRGALDSFFNAFESLAARPNDATTRQIVFQEAKGLVDTFHRMDQRFSLLAGELDQQIKDEVDELNIRLEELQTINREIARLEVGSPGSALDLRDQRQQKLEEIAEYALIEVEEVDGSNGQISLGMRDAEGELVELVSPDNPYREIRFNTETRAYEIAATGEELEMESGRLNAIRRVRDDAVGDLQSQIDRLANAVATQVNELYYQGYQAAGANPEVPEISFFQQPTPPPSVSGQPGEVTASTIELYSSPSDPDTVGDFVPLNADTLRATETEASGANELALALAELATADIGDLGGLTFSEFALRRTTELGQDIRDVQNRMEVQEDVVEVLRTRRGEVSGVSMDEEVSNLVQYQRAFQASSRYFNVLSEMLEELIASLGR